MNEKNTITDAGNLSKDDQELLSCLLEEEGIEHSETGIPRRANSSRAPLSFAQERLWFLDQLRPGASNYNLPGSLRIKGGFDRRALERAFGEIIRRHEVFRTVFTTEDGMPVQVIQPHGPACIAIADLERLAPAERESEATLRAQQERRLPFDLASGPLIRMTLVRLAADDHLVLCTMHHIIADGWSSEILMREIRALYEAFSGGKASPLPDLPVQYGDFAAWQRQWLQGEALDRRLAYWKEHLKGAPPVVTIPPDRPRPPVQTFAGARRRLTLSTRVTEALKDLAKSEGLTLFMLLLAGFKTLIYRYTQQQDIVVGTIIANRTRRETEGVIGLFANSLGLRSRVTGTMKVRDLLRQVREVCLDAYENQDVPFERVVEELQPERNLSYNPVFQVALLPASVRHDVSVTNFDLLMAVQETGSTMSLALTFNTDLYTASTADKLLECYVVLLESIAACPDECISRLPMLSENEKRRILLDGNNTAKEYPLPCFIHRRIEAEAEMRPEAVALAFDGEELTYGELNRKANRLANRLMELGVGPETLVGICAERSLEMVVGLLAILKAGGAYVPFDPAYPASRIDYMVRDSGVGILLTQRRLADGWRSRVKRVLCLDAAEEYTGATCSDPRISLAEDNAAYVIYTSGSTGQPKGAVNTHRGIYNRLMWMQEAYRLDASDAVLQKTPFSFDVSVWEFFWPLMAGARLVLARPRGHQDPEYLAELLKDEHITTIHFVPAMLQEFLQHADIGKCVALRRVICSGEALSVALQEKFFAHSQAALFNLYGPTEASVDVTAWRCERVTSTQRRTVPIGRPISNIRMYVLDGELQPVAQGVVSELYIAGDGLARGYHRRPDLTGAMFIPNPFGGPGERLYRTGDLGRICAGGELEYAGRADHQVKIRGVRIELAEIEHALRQFPGIQEGIAHVREDKPGDKRLIAYVVSPSMTASRLNELRRHLKETLPEAFVPAAVVQLNALPLTSSGKVDRSALQVPESERPNLDQAYVEPQTGSEQRIATIWCELLGISRVGVHDSFFELGGHSLLLTQLASRINTAFNVRLPLRLLFDAPTIRHIVIAITAEQLKQVESDETALLLEELKHLTPEEAKVLLESEELQ